ncbi:hypothetical protein [Jiulongibacter sediminis]|uniref:Uncharacterized protein n=1 Tax=Jiulongibacter sediminis TaxID=1605367 RepID=A0A0P7C100_9BACT|nr:hypothetical protein [Jiulongibacter sediminis]KPM46965.1 hypothetical protein AFM12_17190 [Jiulongibacter sediminis]TBX22311.1 hypothetical protein TK44_17195 [Jiulongibacter sediminis]
MLSRLPLLYLLLISPLVFSQIQNSKPEPRFLLKAAATFNADFNFESSTSGLFNAETEILLNSKNAIRLGIEASAGQTINEMEFKFPFLAYRRYFEPVTGSGVPNFTAAYLGAVAYLSGRSGVPKGEEPTVWNTEFFITNRPFLPNNGFGFEYGRQSFGIVDFGVFAGIESLDEKVAVNGSSIQLKSVFSPMIRSYNRFTIPIALSTDFYKNIQAYYKPSFDRNKLLRIGLDDVFAFSKKGLFFHPKIAYEQNIGKSYFSGLAKVSGLMSRAKYYDVNDFDSVSEVSEKPYLNQIVAFLGAAQIRYYASSAIKKNQNFLNGIYLFGEASVESGSIEVKRQYWEFEKFSNHFLGGGLGLQQQLFNDLLVDAYIASGLSTGPALLKAGLELYWVK